MKTISPMRGWLGCQRITCAALLLLIPAASFAGDSATVHNTDVSDTETADAFDIPLTARSVAFVREGDRLLRQGDKNGAAHAYAQAAEQSPRSPLLRLMLGVALAQLSASDNSKNRLAVSELRMAIRLAEDDLMAALLLQGALTDAGELAEAQGVYLDAVRRFSRPNRSALNASVSIARLTRAASRFPDSPMLHLLLGDAYQVAEEWSQSDSHYRRAIALAPVWAKPRVNLGLSQMAQGRWNDAITVLESALVRDPTNIQAQISKADAQRQSGRTDDAIHSYGQMLSKPRASVQAFTGMGRAFMDAGRSEEAIKTLGAARRIAPDDPTPPAALGEAQVKIGDYNAGAENYRVALRLTKGGGLFSARPFLYRALIEAQLSARKPDDAQESIRRAIADEPTSVPLWQRLSAQAYFDKGDRASGQMALHHALVSEISEPATEASYPQETLNAIAAHNMIAALEDTYQSDLDAEEGSRLRGLNLGGNQRSVSSAPPATAAVRAVAAVALAHLARYQGHFDMELHLRKQAVTMRGTAADWYFLGETYDMRRNDPQNTVMAYRRALALPGLAEAARNLAQERCRSLSRSPLPRAPTPLPSRRR